MTNRHACYRHRRWQRRPVWWPAWANRRKGGRKQLDSKDAQDAQDTGGSSRLLHRPRAWATAGVLAFWRSGGVRAGVLAGWTGTTPGAEIRPVCAMFCSPTAIVPRRNDWGPLAAGWQACADLRRRAASCRLLQALAGVHALLLLTLLMATGCRALGAGKAPRLRR